MELDVRRLRILREVALRGTISAAAASLGFTPSAISQQLSALERECGTVLLERAGRRVRLTFAGQSLVEHTGPVLAALEEARAALESSRTAVGGDLHIAASGSVAQALVLPVAARLAAAYPRLRLTVAEHDPDQGLRELRLGGLDVLVAFEYDHDQRAPEPDLVRADLLTEQMLMAVPASWTGPAVPAALAAPAGLGARAGPGGESGPVSRAGLGGESGPVSRAGPAAAAGLVTGAGPAGWAGPVALADLAGEIWAAEPAANTCGRAVRAACRAAGFEPDIRYVSAETGVVLAAVRTAGAVALIPSLGLAAPPPGVRILPLADASIRRRVFAAYRRGSAGRPSVALILSELRAAAGLAGSPELLAGG
jgi:DNA-binding transcriptional LysR family regulator